MLCPNCGNNCADANFCSNCGKKTTLTDWFVSVNINKPPIGRYEGLDGYIELSFCTVTFHKEMPTQTTERIMSFRDIQDVKYHQSTEQERGFFAVREINDRLPVSQTEWDALVDETALLLGENTHEKFLELFAFLSWCKEAVQAREKITRDARSICPKCKSSNIKERLATVPVVHWIKDEYFCCTCGYEWNAKRYIARKMKDLSDF